MNVSACLNRQQGSSDRFLYVSFCLCPRFTRELPEMDFLWLRRPISCFDSLVAPGSLYATNRQQRSSSCRTGASQHGHIQAAGRDAIHTVHYHYQSHAEPLGTRIDVSALRDLKGHRDLGEKILEDIKCGDGESGSRWAEIDMWWNEAITKSNQNVFAPIFGLNDLESHGRNAISYVL